MADRHIDVYLPLHADTLKMRTWQGDFQPTWRTFSWMMSKSEAQITSVETTMAIRDIGNNAGEPATTTPR